MSCGVLYKVVFCSLWEEGESGEQEIPSSDSLVVCDIFASRRGS